MSFSNSEAKSLQKAIEQAVSNGATSYTRKYRSEEVAKSAGLMMNGDFTVVPLACGEAVLVVDLSGVVDEIESFYLLCIPCGRKTEHRVGKRTQVGTCYECMRQEKLSARLIERMWGGLK